MTTSSQWTNGRGRLFFLSAVPTSQRRSAQRQWQRSLQTQQSTITKAICCPDKPTEERPPSTCLAAVMATIVANTTINHHEGHLLSRRANGGASISASSRLVDDKVTWILRDSQNYFTVIGITDGSPPVDNHNKKDLRRIRPKSRSTSGTQRRQEKDLRRPVHDPSSDFFLGKTVDVRYTSLIVPLKTVHVRYTSSLRAFPVLVR
jgi:hypothetical protein